MTLDRLVCWLQKQVASKIFCGLHFDFSQETIQKVSKDGRVHNILEKKFLGTGILMALNTFV